MANLAIQEQEKRVVKVDRLKLINILKNNRSNHIKDYEESMAGYKSLLSTKLSKAFNDAKVELETRYEKLQNRIANFTENDIAKQSDYFNLFSGINVEMKAPKSYAKEYDAAIDMANWDVRETLELSHAEFTCFVRDEWDWKQNFNTISRMYKG